MSNNAHFDHLWENFQAICNIDKDGRHKRLLSLLCGLQLSWLPNVPVCCNAVQHSADAVVRPSQQVQHTQGRWLGLLSAIVYSRNVAISGYGIIIILTLNGQNLVASAVGFLILTFHASGLLSHRSYCLYSLDITRLGDHVSVISATQLNSVRHSPWVGAVGAVSTSMSIRCGITVAMQCRHNGISTYEVNGPSDEMKRRASSGSMAHFTLTVHISRSHCHLDLLLLQQKPGLWPFWQWC